MISRKMILIVSADPATAQECAEQIAVFGRRYRTHAAGTLQEARMAVARSAPAAVFLHESAIGSGHNGETLESVAALFSESAPVVVAAAPEKQAAMAFLITCGAVDFVACASRYLPIVAGLLDRRVRIAEQAAGTERFSTEELSGDFGEILRHEVNNPLTGILGNTELLLARRDRLPPSAIERLETIAELAVRLRETVRRLSNAREGDHEHARPA